MNQPDPTEIQQLPRAYVEKERRWTFLWIVPLLAVALSAGLLWWNQKDEGQLIHIQARDAHDLKIGDPLKYRGAIIGSIESIEIPDNLEHVQLNVRLNQQADHIARANSEFWIVRPELSLTDLKGVDTLLGPRYLQVRPGDGPETLHFTAQVQMPVQTLPEESGLKIVVSTDNTGSLRKGSPLLYRGIQIGTITDAVLAPDARQVDLMISVKPEFKHLPRNNSKFWTESGVSFNLGWSGLNLQTETLESIAVGGLVMATPNQPGLRVDDFHRYDLSTEKPENVDQWNPGLPIQLNTTAAVINIKNRLRPMNMAYKTGRLRTNELQFQGQAFFMDGRWYTSRPLIKAEQQPHQNSQVYVLNSQKISPGDLKFTHGGQLVNFSVEGRYNIETTEALAFADYRAATDLLLITGKTSDYVPPLAIASRYLHWRDNRWLIHPQAGLSGEFEGAIAVTQDKAEVVGMMTQLNGNWYVLPLKP